MAGTAASAAELRPVAWAVPVAGAAFGLVLLAVLVADLEAPIRLALLAALAAAIVGIGRTLGRTRQGRRLAWDGRGRWTLDGRPVAVGPATRVYPGLVVLVLRKLPTPGRAAAPTWSGASTVHWVTRRAAAPEAFRRLKQQLRHGRVSPVAEPAENSPC